MGKEVDENIGFTNIEVSKKGVTMTYSTCGAVGHNKGTIEFRLIYTLRL